jgi:uncharacterized membrane protein
MSIESTSGPTLKTPLEQNWQGYPTTSSEFITVVAHYYRGEIARMISWRDRIDRTSNWAITVVGAMLSLSLATPAGHHGVILFAMVLVLFLLVIESRRYRFFDVYRARVRSLERNYYGRVFSAAAEVESDWMRNLSNDLKQPHFSLSFGQAISRRLRRNYCWMFLILLLAWLIKLTSTRPKPDGGQVELVHSLTEWIRNASIGPLPGAIVIVIVLLFYCWILYAVLRHYRYEGELAYGNVHV